MTRKRGNRYRRNPNNVPIRPIPDSFEDDAKEYLTNLQTLAPVGFKVKNDKGQDIPLRYKDGALQSYVKGQWSDIIGKETKETIKETVTETVTRSSGSGSSEVPASVINRIVQSYIERHILDSNGKLLLDLQPFTFGNYLTFDSSTGDLTSRDTTYSAGTNITIDQNNVISATGGNTYTVASPLEMNNNCISLPTVTSADNGKILKVVNGAWALAEESGGGSGTTWIPSYLYPNTGTTSWTITDNKAQINLSIPQILNVYEGYSVVSSLYSNNTYLFTPTIGEMFYIIKPQEVGQVNIDYTSGQSTEFTTCEVKIIADFNSTTGYIKIEVWHRWYA